MLKTAQRKHNYIYVEHQLFMILYVTNKVLNLDGNSIL